MWIVVIGVGLIALLLGVFTDLYSTTVGIIVAVIVWIAGVPVLKLVMGGAEKKPALEEKPTQAEQKPMEPMAEEPKTEEESPEQPPMEEPRQEA